MGKVSDLALDEQIEKEEKSLSSMSAQTRTYRVWVAGDCADAVRAVREWCAKTGDCYAVSACEYVYSGGSERGVCVTRINYARFPECGQSIENRVGEFAAFLAGSLFQKSYSIEGPEATRYVQLAGVWNA